LGLKAQRTAVTTWLNGGRLKMVDEVVEIESGKSDKNRWTDETAGEIEDKAVLEAAIVDARKPSSTTKSAVTGR
jgi:hypothetical protein